MSFLPRCRIKQLLFAALLTLPLATWAFFKPMRVLTPEWLGLTCTSAGVCVDDVSRLVEAIALKQDAVTFVQARVGAIKEVPKTIFCATTPCAKAFGFTSNGAYNVGTSGLVVSPRGWKPYFVRHELIHHLQNERFGSLANWLFKPKWFIEGMAYSLSDDPRRPLPDPSLEGYRAAYEAWQQQVGSADIWSKAAAL